MINRKKRALSLSLITALSLTLLGCGGTDSTTAVPDTTTENTNSTDITDVIFTKKSSSCSDYVNSYTSSITELKNNTSLSGSVVIVDEGLSCKFEVNSIPNYDVNSANFVEDVAINSNIFSITKTPTPAQSVTALSMRINNGIFLNGVKLDILSAGCYGVGDTKIGCFDEDQPFRLDPMSPLNDFGADEHNAHTQPGGGEYHYHGSPNAMFDTGLAIESPVIGFAADGYPIFGSYFDDNGTIRKAISSYQLKSGTRSAVTFNGTTYNPGGTYDGAYTDDWEYNSTKGDLDECNGMSIDGVYGYYVTDTFPWVLNCYKGTPDSSFEKPTPR